jgi:hypothetical protein
MYVVLRERGEERRRELKRGEERRGEERTFVPRHRIATF